MAQTTSINVKVLRSTDDPERVVCRAARGDYYDGFVGDVSYEELMEAVEVKDHHYDIVRNVSPKIACSDETFEQDVIPYHEAATAAFIEKEASRGHWGIWEHPSITFAVEGVSRVTMAQITRHRHMSFDVQSMRYVNFDDAEVMIPPSLDKEDHFTRSQGEVNVEDREGLKNEFKKHVETSFDLYQKLVDSGVPEEDARYLLPLGTKVNLTFSGNARTMLHVLNLRQRADAQYEIRQLSDALFQHLSDWLPYTSNWWEKKGPVQISP